MQDTTVQPGDPSLSEGNPLQTRESHPLISKAVVSTDHSAEEIAAFKLFLGSPKQPDHGPPMPQGLHGLEMGSSIHPNLLRDFDVAQADNDTQRLSQKGDKIPPRALLAVYPDGIQAAEFIEQPVLGNGDNEERAQIIAYLKLLAIA